MRTALFPRAVAQFARRRQPACFGHTFAALRAFSTASHGADAPNTRNIALLAHIDSGKTTLTESILLASGYLSASGTVDTGSTATDFLPAERERGITIQSASVPVKWKGWSFNLVDTPGHADFGMEVESASRIIDGAVVLMDSVEGVESQTLGVWSQLNRHQVPTRIIFINKLDRSGASLESSIKSILAHRLHPKPTVLTLPIASFDPLAYSRAEPGLEGIVDLVNWQIWKKTEGDDSVCIPLPATEAELKETSLFPSTHPLIPHLLPARAALIDNLSIHSEDLLSAFLDVEHEASPYLALKAPRILAALREATLKNDILPVVCGAALRHVGTEPFMTFIGELLASPIDVSPSGTAIATGEVQMIAWKVVWDKRKGWMTFVRVYSGTLTRQTVLLNKSTQQKERISKILLMYASEPEEVSSLPFGSVGVILGLKHTRTGDTLVSTALGSKNASQSSSTSLRDIKPPPAVISASVVPQSNSDIQPVQEALTALSRTDPSVRITEDELEAQTLVHGLGALHLEIVERRLAEEWGVRCTFGRRRVSYREGFAGEECLVDEKWQRDIGGKTVGAMVALKVRQLRLDESGDENWGGNIVIDSESNNLASPDVFMDYPPESPLPKILQGIRTTLASSPHTTLPLSGVHITLVSYTLDTGSPPPIFSAASAHSLRRAITDAGMGTIMEPYAQVKVDVGEDLVGKVVKDLTEHGGEIQDLAWGASSADGEDSQPYSTDDVYVPPSWLTPSTYVAPGDSSNNPRPKRSVHAVVPLTKMLDYNSRLRAVSGGMGSFEMSIEGFRAVGDVRRQEILQELGRI